jgi:phage shock protein PspC (stress-responsive transcriptional regulator)
MAHSVQTNARRVFIVLLVLGLGVAAYVGWWLFTTTPS